MWQGWSFPSTSSTWNITPVLQQQIKSPLLPNGWGFGGTNIKPGQYWFNHTIIDSSKQVIQLDRKLASIFSFHASISCLNSQKPSFWVGGALSVKRSELKIALKWVRLIHLLRRNGAPSNPSMGVDDQKLRCLGPTTVAIKNQRLSHLKSSPYWSGSPIMTWFISGSMVSKTESLGNSISKSCNHVDLTDTPWVNICTDAWVLLTFWDLQEEILGANQSLKI